MNDTDTSAAVETKDPVPGQSSHLPPQVVTWSKRTRFNPIRHLTPERLAASIDRFQVGWLREFALLQDSIKHRDATVTVALRKREKSVARHGFQILISDGLSEQEKKTAEKHQAALRFFYSNLTASNVLEQDERGGFRLLVEQMMSSVGFRYAVHEIVWTPTFDPVTGEGRLTANFNFVPLWFFEATTAKLRFIPNIYAQVYGEDMAEEEWLVTVSEGIMEPIAIAYMFKNMSLKDWLAFSERFGTPGVLGKTAAAKDSAAWNQMAEAVESFGQEWSAVVSQDGSLELIEAKGGSGSLPFPPLVEYMDKQIATVCRGGDLSTISSGHGMGRGASLQGDESSLMEEDDAALITESLQKVSREVIEQIFGEGTVPLAYLKVMVPEKKNNTDTINKVQAIVNAGGRVSMDWYMQELGVPPAAQDAPPESVVQKIVGALPAPTLPETDTTKLANAAAEAGMSSIFKAHAAADQLASRRPVFKPIALRLAALLAVAGDPAALLAGAEALKTDSGRLYREVVAQAPDLAKPAQEAIGTAVVAGFAAAAQARK